MRCFTGFCQFSQNIYKKYFTASISQKEFDSIVDEALALYFARKEAAAV